MFRAFWIHLIRRQSRKSRYRRPAAQRWRNLWSVRPQLQMLENRLVPAGTYTVTNLSDALPPPVGVDIRQAIALANADPGSTVKFADGMDGTIALQQGDLDITANMTIDGTGHTLVVAGGSDRAFDISAVGTVTITNLTIQNGRAPAGEGGGSGGAIYDASPSSILILNHDNIQLNFAAGNGGGVYSNGQVTLSNTTVEANNAVGLGGGVFAAKNLTVNTSTISDNSGSEGGGLYEAGTGTTVMLTMSTVTHNRATHGDGGGVFAEFDVIATASSITDNVALGGDGGGIYSASGDVTLSSTTVSTNTATGEGGGVKADLNVILAASHVNSNIGNMGGGGIWSDEGYVLLSGGSTVSGNSAGAGTAGATAMGGGIWSGTDVLVSGSTVADNTTNGNGGGIFALGSVNLSGDRTVSGNTAVATDTTNGNGGGIFARVDVLVAGSTVSGNTAGHDGGGIHATGNVFLFTSASVADNTAGRDGGGIWGGSLSNISIISSTVSGNTVGNNGGGVYLAADDVEESGSLYVDSSTISNNFAFNEGGGVYADTVEAVTVLNSTISGNTVALNGGGIAAIGVINLSITGSSVLDNAALSGEGGGLYNIGEGTNTDLDSDSFTGNSAGVSGGAVYVSAVDMTINNVFFDDNVSYGGPRTGSDLFATDAAMVILSNDDFDDSHGLSALLSTDLIDSSGGAVCSSAGGNEVADSSWVNIANFSPLIGDHGNA